MVSRHVTAGKVGRPSKTVTDQLDETLLDMAIQAMHDADFAEISLEGVAARIGVSRPTLYRRFKSRDALLEAMVRREFSSLFEAVPADEGGQEDPVGMLRSLARQFFTVFMRPGTANFVKLLTQESNRNSRLGESRKEWHQQVVSRLLPSIGRAQELGAFRPQDPVRLADLLVGLLDTPVGLSTMGFDKAGSLSGLSEAEFFEWRFGIFLQAAS